MLPLHGYSYSETPLWAGIYMIPLMIGFVSMGPISGWLSDRYGARLLSTLGMVIVGSGFLALSTLSYDFSYPEFAAIIFFMGIGNGMFASPNTASIMNSVPKEVRGSASGMRATLQNTGQTASIAMFFTIVIITLSGVLPHTLAASLTDAGAPQLAPVAYHIPVTGALFSAFLGYNPVREIISTLPPSVVSTIPHSVLSTIEARDWFPDAIAPAFMQALRVAFYVGAAMSFVAAIVSAMRGKVVIAEEDKVPERKGEIKQQ